MMQMVNRRFPRVGVIKWCNIVVGKENGECQGVSKTENVVHPSTRGAPMYLQNGHSRG